MNIESSYKDNLESLELIIIKLQKMIEVSEERAELKDNSKYLTPLIRRLLFDMLTLKKVLKTERSFLKQEREILKMKAFVDFWKQELHIL